MAKKRKIEELEKQTSEEDRKMELEEEKDRLDGI
jgi:hypothetical protein